MQGSAPGTERFEDGRGLRWVVLPAFREALLAQISPRLPPREDGDLRVLKRSKRRQVYAHAGSGVPPLVVKRYPARKRFPDSLRDSLRTRARDEFEIGQHLWESGFATPTPVGYAERWHRGRIRESYYVLEELRGARTLGPWLESRFTPGDGSEVKLQWIQRAGATLDRLHAHGIYHRDFHGGNLLLREAEGPQGRLFLIDFPVALRLGTVPRKLCARDQADLLYSLRHVLDDAEQDLLVQRLCQGDVDPDQLQQALIAKRRRARHDRLQRAFRSSSQFAVHRRNGWIVYRDRSLEEERVGTLLADHARSVREADEQLLRVGSKTRLSMHPAPPDPGVVVKEFLPQRGSARRRARAAWRGGVALQVADLPTTQPLALVLGRNGESSWVLSKASPDSFPIHLFAHRRLVGAKNQAAVQRIAERVGELLVQLVQAEVHHPDLSLKNLLLRQPYSDQPEVLLIDWDGVRPRRTWTEGRLARALAQLGDVPALNLRRSARLRFVRELLTRLGAPERTQALYRIATERLRRRRKLDRFVGGTP